LSALAEAIHRFDPPWIKVGRIYRHICFLRSEGLGAEAKRIEDTELEEAAAEARATESDGDTQLKAFYAQEQERVAEAIAFAEVLVPALSGHFSSPETAKARSPVPAPRSKARSARSEPGIADYIDEMLAQDRAEGR
jgi:hypothetical protein